MTTLKSQEVEAQWHFEQHNSQPTQIELIQSADEASDMQWLEGGGIPTTDW